jgi:hypothetical protein
MAMKLSLSGKGKMLAIQSTVKRTGMAQMAILIFFMALKLSKWSVLRDVAGGRSGQIRGRAGVSSQRRSVQAFSVRK